MNIRNSSTPTKKYRLILSAVHMIYRLVNSTYNVRELALRLTRLLCQFINASSSTVHILDPEKKKVIMIAIFDNKINILYTKKKELALVTPLEKRVSDGYIVFEKHFIGLPLVADDNIGAVFVKRKRNAPVFTDFDKEMLSVVAEQSVTAIKNLQLYEQQQKVILGSIEFIGNLLESQGEWSSAAHTSVFFKIVKSIALRLKMTREEIDQLYYASVLRGAGTIDVPYEVLSKTSQLTSEEFAIIQNQPKKSVELIKPVEFLRPVLPILLYHHERYDGTGYPSGLRKDQIPLGARIMAVVGAFEAMVRARSYKKRLSVANALLELTRNSGTQFDPEVVNVFIELSKQKKFRNYLSYTRR